MRILSLAVLMGVDVHAVKGYHHEYIHFKTSMMKLLGKCLHKACNYILRHV